MFQALYRKYRPQTFKDIVGQNHIVSVLKNAIEKNQISHAYLFYGPRGTGKTSIAKIFANEVNKNEVYQKENVDMKFVILKKRLSFYRVKGSIKFI